MHAFINLCVFSHLIIRKKHGSCFEFGEAKLIDIHSSQWSGKKHPVLWALYYITVIQLSQVLHGPDVPKIFLSDLYC